MPWRIGGSRERHPLLQMGWELVGAMVKRRRELLGWSQRELAHRSGTSQSVISRFETGKLRGLKFQRFAAMVAVMGGLDVAAPRPPYRSIHPELHAPIRLDYADDGGDLHQWLPNRNGGSYTSKDLRPSPFTVRAGADGVVDLAPPDEAD
jgi:transcriptional regulator with XRE-family HTH domain